MLNCNALSQSRLKTANEDFRKNVKLLTEMKKDLDYIFRKIRIIKQKLSKQYPEAYSEAQPTQRSSLAEEALGAEANNVSPANSKPSSSNNTTERRTTTVEYVQMEETIENGKPIENELIKRVCSIETTNPNDSSDCTSEDTG